MDFLQKKQQREWSLGSGLRLQWGPGPSQLGHPEQSPREQLLNGLELLLGAGPGRAGWSRGCGWSWVGVSAFPFGTRDAPVLFFQAELLCSPELC